MNAAMILDFVFCSNWINSSTLVNIEDEILGAKVFEQGILEAFKISSFAGVAAH